MYVEVVVCKTKTSRKLFTYKSVQIVKPGNIIEVPFGKNNLPAIAISVVNKPTFNTKEVTANYGLSLPSSHLELLKWMLNFYPDDYGLIGGQFIPANFATKPKRHVPQKVAGKNLPLPKPTKQQQVAIEKIKTENKVVLHGITGSGKTRVFTEKIIATLQSGKNVLVVTPEIGLTPQLVYDIANYVSYPVVVNHSMIAPAERRRIWDYASANTEPTVYVGPRSSLFMPINNIGLIVVDEFHDHSLKQQNAPRYSSLHITSKLAELNRAPVILSSATPNASEFYQLKKAGYHTLKMDQLAVANLPALGELIDTSNRDLFKRSKYLAEPILDAIDACLKNGEQSMLMLNRRGSARLVKCSTCGWQAICSICGLPLTYHHDNFTLSCHSCGKKSAAPKTCPECSSVEIIFKTIGTKALTEHLSALFPKAKIARFDSDLPASQQLHRNISDLKAGQADIIVGTQIISKGIDLPKLGMVGVVSADAGLALPDFSAEESLFQQLYQVTGRVGRGHRESKFFIQTINPEHPVMQAALKRDYKMFYNYEISKRKMFNYPPFCFLAIIKITKKTSKNAQAAMTKIYDQLSKNQNLSILGPSPSFYEKSPKGYAWQIIIKSSKRSAILEALDELPTTDLTIDLDPISLL